MSYILEALRRSQAERERGQVPGLHAQPALNEPALQPRRGVPLRWTVAAIAATALLAGLVALLNRERPAPPSATPAIAGQPLPAAPPLTQPSAVVQPPPAQEAVAQAPFGQQPSAPTPPSQMPPSQTPSSQLTPRQPSQPLPPSLPQVVSLPPAAIAPSPAAAQPPPAPAPRTLRLAELSAEQRRDMPPLVAGGSVWSDSAASRFVIINGQVVHEGEAAAPGVVLERIAPKAATLRWRELRVELPL